MTHKQRVLELLSDGEWHTHHEGYALNVMMHSRVSDLRADGYVIECDKSSRPYRYRLLQGAAVDASAARASRPAVPSSELVADTSGQLTLATPEFRRRHAA